jgi:FAD/FMN-containing dehydrogenase
LNKEFARRFVISGSVIIVVVHPYVASPARTARRNTSYRDCSREKKMKKTILTIVGSALIALSAVQLAAAASERHKGKMKQSPTASTQFRDSNAYVPPAYNAYGGYAAPAYDAYGAVEPEWYRYSGGISAPAGR